MDIKRDFNVIVEDKKRATRPKYKFIREIGTMGPK